MSSDSTAALVTPVMAVTELCDCEGGHPCSHGDYVYAFHLDEPQPYYVDRAKRLDTDIPYYAYTYSEVVEFPDWLTTRILLSGDLVQVLTDLVTGDPPEGAVERGRHLLARLSESPMDVVIAAHEPGLNGPSAPADATYDSPDHTRETGTER